MDPFLVPFGFLGFPNKQLRAQSASRATRGFFSRWVLGAPNSRSTTQAPGTWMSQKVRINGQWMSYNLPMGLKTLHVLEGFYGQSPGFLGGQNPLFFMVLGAHGAYRWDILGL